MFNKLNEQNKDYLIPFIECFILSLPLLCVALILPFSAIIIIISYLLPDTTEIEAIGAVATWIGYFILIPVVNIVFYSILKKKCKLGRNVFLYGVGFTASFITALLVISYDPLHGFSLPPYIWAFYVIPVLSLFYLFALLPKNNEKAVRVIALCLIVAAILFLTFGVMLNSEIFNQLEFLMFILPIPFGLYAGHCVIYRKLSINPRNLAWTFPSLLLAWGIGNVFMIISGYNYTDPSNAIDFIYFFIISVIVSCLIGVAHKYLTKKKKSDGKETG